MIYHALFTIQTSAVSDINNGLSFSSSTKLTYSTTCVVALPLNDKKYLKINKSFYLISCKLLKPQVFVWTYFCKIAQNGEISNTNPLKVLSL